MLSLQDMRMIVMNEAKIVHGKTVIPKLPESILKELAKQMVNEGEFKTEEEAMAALQSSDEDVISISTSDSYTGFIQKQLESYDKEMDEAVLRAENIVAAYNAMNEARFDEAIKKLQKIDEMESKSDAEEAGSNLYKTMPAAIEVMAAAYNKLSKTEGINEAELKRSLLSGVVYESEDPDMIRKMIQLRINYNNNMINLFKAMLQNNYQILGFSKDEALLLSQQIVSDNQEQRQKSIKTIKEALLANKKKFDRGNGIIDMRDIGAGVIFGTEKETGMDKFISIDRMIQLSMKYDAIVFGHGGSSGSTSVQEYQRAAQRLDKAKKDAEKFEKEHSELLKKIEEDSERYEKTFEKYANSKDPIIISRYELYSRELDNIRATIKKLRAREMKMRLTNNKVYKVYEDAEDRYAEMLKNGEISEEDRKKIERHCDKLYRNWRKLDDRKRKLHNMINEYYNKADSYRDEIDSIIASSSDTDRLPDKVIKKKYKEIVDIAEDVKKEYDEAMNEFDMQDRHMQNGIGDIFDRKKVWHIQPVNTLHHGVFIDMNDLIKALIDEGFKKIFIMSCNPGHHELDPEIKKRKGVIINHAMNSLLAESAVSEYPEYSPLLNESFDVDNPIDMAEYYIHETHKHLYQVCNECGIDYLDDVYLNECLTQYDSICDELMNEGIGDVAKKAWTTVVNAIKKAIGFVVALIKKILEFFSNILKKIKNFFAKLFEKKDRIDELSKPVNTKFILVESASMKSFTFKNWSEMQKAAVASCEKIAARINKLEKEQTDNLKKTLQYAEQQERKSGNRPTNESAIMTLAEMRAYAEGIF